MVQGPRQDVADSPLSPEEGGLLLALARDTIAAKLDPAENTPPQDPRLATERMRRMLGVFVTLKLNGALRGCIGNIVPCRPLVEGVKENAINAAFNDYRFKPLSKQELPAIDIELSVLSPLQELNFSAPDELLSILRPGVDGVLLEWGRLSSTFLPQVWEQLPSPQSFLEHLSQKAGLPADAWRRSDLKVKTYTVQSFSSPNRI